MNEEDEKKYLKERAEAQAKIINHSMMRKLGRAIPKSERVLGPDIPLVTKKYDPHKW